MTTLAPQLYLQGFQPPNSKPKSGDKNGKVVENIYFGRELGTFKDSLRAPVHRWFKYPAGYSYKFVDASFDVFGVNPGDWVYDPFSGTGTTLIQAKQRNINAYGAEAHSFVHWVAQTKLYWEYNPKNLAWKIERTLQEMQQFLNQQTELADTEGVFPELIYKCYHPLDLKTLYLLREFILKEIPVSPFQDLLKLALTDTLRAAATAGTGWPYIAPRKNQEKTYKGAFAVFQNIIRQMYQDLLQMGQYQSKSKVQNVLSDSRTRQRLADRQVKLALTSPPYLNNYDYADRTRLETYFWGITQSWREITRYFRDKLMVSATTQIVRGRYNVETALSADIQAAAPGVYNHLQDAVLRLAELRLTKGGKKSYDLLVALYFNDIFEVMRETYRVLDKGAAFCLVLGDSAPYGVHIQTDQVIGQLGLGIGFSHFMYQELRRRGEKWKGNPQRHKVGLREGVVILKK